MARRRRGIDPRLPLIDAKRVVSLDCVCGHVEHREVPESMSDAIAESIKRNEVATRCSACIEADAWDWIK